MPRRNDGQADPIRPEAGASLMLQLHGFAAVSDRCFKKCAGNIFAFAFKFDSA
jgi:hypothetical protein